MNEEDRKVSQPEHACMIGRYYAVCMWLATTQQWQVWHHGRHASQTKHLCREIMLMQKDDAHAVALSGAAVALLKSGSLRPRVVASLRAASSGFRQLCQEHEVSTAADACKVPAAAGMISRTLPLHHAVDVVRTAHCIVCGRASCGLRRS
jgi:hypothetical protein